MQVIGMLGGMSWESTLEYYRIINQEIRQRLGRQHSAELLLYSVDFEDVERLQVAGEWDRAGQLLASAARRLERGGAQLLLICSNTMHKVAPAVDAAVTIPLVHIADAIAAEIKRSAFERVGLLGTRFTMEQDFYRDRLVEQGLEVLVPEREDRELVDRVIYSELCQGRVNAESRREYIRIIQALGERGTEAVVLGCTEIGLLVRPEDSPIPVLDSTRIHALEGVEQALADNKV
jgi:aspartate racemase